VIGKSIRRLEDEMIERRSRRATEESQIKVTSEEDKQSKGSELNMSFDTVNRIKDSPIVPKQIHGDYVPMREFRSIIKESEEEEKKVEQEGLEPRERTNSGFTLGI